MHAWHATWTPFLKNPKAYSYGVRTIPSQDGVSTRCSSAHQVTTHRRPILIGNNGLPGAAKGRKDPRACPRGPLEIHVMTGCVYLAQHFLAHVRYMLLPLRAHAEIITDEQATKQSCGWFVDRSYSRVSRFTMPRSASSGGSCPMTIAPFSLCKVCSTWHFAPPQKRAGPAYIEVPLEREVLLNFEGCVA